MVGGLETFRDAFREYSDSFVIIGGTACEEVLQGTDQKSRATLDIDLIVIADNMTPQFAGRFWQFISDGAYRPGIRKNADGSLKYVLYSFTDGKPGYPIQIELLSHHNEVFSSSRPSHIEPLPIDGDVSSPHLPIMPFGEQQTIRTGSFLWVTAPALKFPVLNLRQRNRSIC